MNSNPVFARTRTENIRSESDIRIALWQRRRDARADTDTNVSEVKRDRRAGLYRGYRWWSAIHTSRGGGVKTTCDQDLTRSGACDEHVSAEIADRNLISATRHIKMARATPNNTKAARKEAKLKYKLKPN